MVKKRRLIPLRIVFLYWGISGAILFIIFQFLFPNFLGISFHLKNIIGAAIFIGFLAVVNALIKENASRETKKAFGLR